MKAFEDVARISAPSSGARYPGQRFPDIAISRLKTLDCSSGLRRLTFMLNERIAKPVFVGAGFKPAPICATADKSGLGRALARLQTRVNALVCPSLHLHDAGR